MQQSLEQTGEVVMYQPDETIRLEVRMDHETVWLTTRQMAILFGREESNIRRHVINVFKEKELSRENNVQILHVNDIYKTGELEQESTCAKIAQVQIEGKRMISRDDEVYHIGASIKDLGKKWFAFTLMHDIKAAELIKKIRN